MSTKPNIRQIEGALHAVTVDGGPEVNPKVLDFSSVFQVDDMGNDVYSVTLTGGGSTITWQTDGVADAVAGTANFLNNFSITDQGSGVVNVTLNDSINFGDVHTANTSDHQYFSAAWDGTKNIVKLQNDGVDNVVLDGTNLTISATTVFDGALPQWDSGSGIVDLVHTGGGQVVGGDFETTGGITAAGVNFTAKAESTGNAHYWLKDHNGVNKGLLYWDRAAGHIKIRRYNADGSAAEGEITLGANDILWNGTDILHGNSSDRSIAGSLGIGVVPTSTFNNGKAIALGDGDTGIRQNGDGVLELWGNNQLCFYVDGLNIYSQKRHYFNAEFTVNSSDKTLKKNFREMNIAELRDKLVQIQWLLYDLKDDSASDLFGVIAQQVQKILPEVVCENPSTGKLAVSYPMIHNYWAAVNAWQEERLQDQEERIKELEAKWDQLLQATR